MGTQQFWICPKCRKHVPVRSEACACGFSRAGLSGVQLEGPSRTVVQHDEPEQQAILPLLLKTVGVIGGLAILIPIGIRAWRNEAPQPEGAKQLLAPQQPPLQLPPLMVIREARPSPESAPTASPDVLASLAPAAPPEPSPEATNEPSPIPLASSESESDVDKARRVGNGDFERAVAVLAAKADQADVAWKRYEEGCRQNVTYVRAVAGVGDREWIALAGVEVVRIEWTTACAEAGTFFALVKQVRDGMCVAEDRARTLWVYPGMRREIRHRYRLDWDGWDRACR